MNDIRIIRLMADEIWKVGEHFEKSTDPDIRKASDMVKAFVSELHAFAHNIDKKEKE